MATYSFTQVGNGATFKKDEGESLSVRADQLRYMNVSEDGNVIKFAISGVGSQYEIKSADTINVNGVAATGNMTTKRDQILSEVFFLAVEEGEGGVAGVSSFKSRTGAVNPASGDYTFDQIGDKPTTIAGFGITDVIPADIVANTAARHSHANKGLLDTYTQTESNIADAVAKKHAHANQTALDAVTGVNTGNQDLSGLALLEHTHTAGNISDFSTAVAENSNVAANTAARHTHSNITALNAVLGTNTGDQTTIVGITGTKAQFNAALTDGDFATLDGAETMANKSLTSPSLTGTPLTPTAAPGTNTSQVASTAFVKAAADIGKPEVVASFADISARTDARHVYVAADETKGGYKAIYFHNGTSLEFLQTIE